ncbi:MAG: glycosyltransferase 87 family protein [Micrococcaceae bacterium]
MLIQDTPTGSVIDKIPAKYLTDKRLTMFAIASFVITHVGLLIYLQLSFISGNKIEHDVRLYHDWLQHGLTQNQWVGVQLPWVYPLGAWVPIGVAGLLKMPNYGFAFYIIITIANLLCTIHLFRYGRKGKITIVIWMVFNAILYYFLGTRLDSFTVPLVISGMLMFFSQSVFSGSALIALATWVKVWPAGFILPALAKNNPKRKIILISGIFVTALMALFAWTRGGFQNFLSFLTEQSSRGVQYEAPIALPYVILSDMHVPGFRQYFDDILQTQSVSGPFIGFFSILSNIAMAVLAIVITYLSYSFSKSKDSDEMLRVIVTTMIAGLILFNKVGSPQYIFWLLAPLLVGYLLAEERHQKFWNSIAQALFVIAVAICFQYATSWNLLALIFRHTALVVLFVLCLKQIHHLIIRRKDAAVIAAHEEAVRKGSIAEGEHALILGLKRL